MQAEVTRMRRADIQEITLKFSIYYFISLHFKYIKMTIYLFYSIITFNKKEDKKYATKKQKNLAALLMSGIMTLSIAPVVHADDKVELTGMVQQSRWYSGLQSMVEKLEEEENISIEFEVVPDDQYDNLMKMRLNSHEAPDLIAYQFADLFAAVDPEETFLFH